MEVAIYGEFCLEQQMKEAEMLLSLGQFRILLLYPFNVSLIIKASSSA